MYICKHTCLIIGTHTHTYTQRHPRAKAGGKAGKGGGKVLKIWDESSSRVKLLSMEGQVTPNTFRLLEAVSRPRTGNCTAPNTARARFAVRGELDVQLPHPQYSSNSSGGGGGSPGLHYLPRGNSPRTVSSF